MALATPRGAAADRRSFDARARALFLDELAMTANVSASARKAGIAPHIAYAHRRRSAEFATRWQAALAEGFARLEGDLLAEALTAASGKISDAALKSRAQRHRLGLALLSLHRASVRGTKAENGHGASTATQRAELARKVEAKINAMRRRLPGGHSSRAMTASPQADDVRLGTGDGTTTRFALVKRYGAGPDAEVRRITWPVAESVRVAINGSPQLRGCRVNMAGRSVLAQVSARPGQRVRRIWADGKLLRGAAGDFKVATGFRFHSGAEDGAPDPLIAAVEGAGQTPAYRGLAYCVFEDLAVESFGNRIPLLSFELVAEPGPVRVETILNSVGAGLVTARCDTVLTGYIAEGGTIRETLAPLVRLYGLAAWDDGAQLRLAAPAPAQQTIAAKALGARAGREGGPDWTRQMAARANLPSAVQLGYADPARDFQPGTQSADLFAPGQTLSWTLPGALDAGSARQLALSALMAQRAQADELSLSVPWQGLSLVTGGTTRVAGLPGDWQIAQLSVEAMRIALTLHRPPPALAGLAAADPGRGVAAPDETHGPTRLVLAELPWLDAGLGQQPVLVAAAAGTSPGWRRAQLMQSGDGGATWTAIGTTAPPAVLGTLVGPAAPGPSDMIDGRTRLMLALLHDEMELSSCSIDALLAGRNLLYVGGELIQFGATAAKGGEPLMAGPCPQRPRRLARRGRPHAGMAGLSIGKRRLVAACDPAVEAWLIACPH
ncbi:MAG: phage tail protein [Chakrabartia sp.]